MATISDASITADANEELRKRIRGILEKGMDKIIAAGSSVILEKGDMLNNEQLFYLKSGRLAFCLDDPRSEEITILYHVPGELVNFLPLLVRCFPINQVLLRKSVPASMFHIRALTTCELVTVDNERFMNELLLDMPMCSLVLYSCVLNLMNIYLKTYNSSILSNSQRICRMILLRMTEGPEYAIPSYLTNTEISTYLSIHPVTVSKVLGKLRSSGIMDKENGRLVVKKLDELRAIAEGDRNLSY